MGARCRQKARWSEGFELEDYGRHIGENGRALGEMAELSAEYEKWIQAENKKTKKEMVVSSVGKINPQLRLTQHIEDIMTANIIQCLGTMLDTKVF